MTLLRDVTVGELTYSSWTFDSFHRCKASSRTVYDDAGRMPKWNEITIECEADIDLQNLVTVEGYETFADAATALYRALSEPGGELIYRGKGIGDLYVNSTQSADASENLKDLNWGPKPQVTEFVPIGSEMVVHVSFKIVTCVVRCPTAKHKDHVFNMTWDASYDLDSDGYLKFSLNGAYEIPLTFSTQDGAGGVLSVPSSADNWWEKVCPPVRVGFQRTSNRRVSRDRRRVDYTITDTELPVPLPPDCTMIEARHKIRGSRDRGFAIWQSTISGTLHMNPRLPRSWSWDRFMLLVAQRMKFARNSGKGVLLTDIEFDENVFGRDQRFSVSYRILGASLPTILQQSGLWLPVAGTSHQLWTDSMKKGPQHPRGNNGAKFTQADDVMIDLCHSPDAVKASQAARPVPSVPPGTPVANAAAAAGAPTGSYPVDAWFTPDDTWLSYDVEATLTIDDHTVRHKPLKGTVEQKQPRAVATGPASTIVNDTNMDAVLTTWSQSDILQQVCSPDAMVVVTGKAMRIGYRINPPRLKTFGGQDVTQLNQRLIEKKLGSVLGVPIWGLAWKFEYALADSPRHMSTLADPLGRINGSGNSGGSANFNTFIERQRAT